MQKFFDFESLKSCTTMCGYPFEFDSNILPETEMFCLRSVDSNGLSHFVNGIDLSDNGWSSVGIRDRYFDTLEELISALIEHERELYPQTVGKWVKIRFMRDDYFLYEDDEDDDRCEDWDDDNDDDLDEFINKLKSLEL